MPYIGKTTDGFGVRNRFVYLASSGDTSVSGADANGATLTFTDGAYVDVYLNGVLLKPTTDYNTSTANTIAGLSALNTNDEVTVVVYDIFTVADMVSATSGGTFSGNVTFNGDATIGDDLTFSSDGAVLSFGADADVTLTHVADQGLTLKSTATDGAGGIGPILNLSTGDTDIAAANQLGTINFQAPDEGTGTDATAVVASITAIAQEDFAADANGTSLLLRTSDSGTNDATHLELTNSGFTKCRKDSDTDFDISSVATNTVLNLRNETAGASNCVSMSFSTESNNEQYITAVTNSTNSNGALAFSRRESSSRLETMRLASNGSVIIGATDQSTDNSAYFENSGILVIRRASDSNATLLSFVNGGSSVGRISSSTSSTSYHTSSDYRLKENVSYDWDATSRLKQLKPARFNFKVDADTTVDGFLAHEVSSIVAEAISGTKDETQDLGTIKDKDGNVLEENILEAKTKKDEGQTWTKTKTEDVYQQIDQSKLVPLLVKTIQELEARVTALEGK